MSRNPKRPHSARNGGGGSRRGKRSGSDDPFREFFKGENGSGSIRSFLNDDLTGESGSGNNNPFVNFYNNLTQGDDLPGGLGDGVITVSHDPLQIDDDIMEYYEMAKAQYRAFTCSVENLSAASVTSKVNVTLNLTADSACKVEGKVIGTGGFGKVIAFNNVPDECKWLEKVVMKSIRITFNNSNGGKRREEEYDRSDRSSREMFPIALREAVLTKYLGDAGVGTPCNNSPIFVHSDRGYSSNLFVASEEETHFSHDKDNIFIFMDRMSNDLSKLRTVLKGRDDIRWKRDGNGSVEFQLREKAGKMIDLGILCVDMKPGNVLYKVDENSQKIDVFFSDFGTDFCCATDSKLSLIVDEELDNYSCTLKSPENDHKKMHYLNLILGMVGSFLQDTKGNLAPILDKEVKYVAKIYSSQFISGKIVNHLRKVDALRQSRDNAWPGNDTDRFDLNPLFSPFTTSFDHYSINALNDLFTQDYVGDYHQEMADYIQAVKYNNKYWNGWGHAGFMKEDPRMKNQGAQLEKYEEEFRWFPASA